MPTIQDQLKPVQPLSPWTYNNLTICEPLYGLNNQPPTSYPRQWSHCGCDLVHGGPQPYEGGDTYLLFENSCQRTCWWNFTPPHLQTIQTPWQHYLWLRSSIHHQIIPRTSQTFRNQIKAYNSLSTTKWWNYRMLQSRNQNLYWNLLLLKPQNLA